MPLNHVALTVSDRERSAAFYARHFGLTERLHDDEHLFMIGSADGSLLDSQRGPGAPGPPGHQPLRLPGRAPWTRCAPRASASGRRASARPNGRTTGASSRVQVEDPDGYRVELFAY